MSEQTGNIIVDSHGNRCPTVASSGRIKDANAAITLLEKIRSFFQ